MADSSFKISIIWFRNDLRLSDNPALCAAVEQGHVLPVYIFDTTTKLAIGTSSSWWLYHSLQSLQLSLEQKLNLYIGDPEKILPEIMQRHNVGAIYWNRSYEPEQIIQEERIQNYCKSVGIESKTFLGSLLWEPSQIVKGDKTPYKVYTPFYYNGCLNATQPRLPMPAPIELNLVKDINNSTTLNQFNLITDTALSDRLASIWNVGELAAQKRLHDFIQKGLIGYKENRDIPSLQGTSRLSPHLHFGEISPNQIWYAVQGSQAVDVPVQDLSCFLSEIAWREFSNNLLYNFPTLPDENYNQKFDGFAWQYNQNFLQAWQQGKTGYPIVDAGMRELAQTGYMHNRVRMIVASFLIKNLLIDWRHGKDWFWNYLVDADLANNSASWQWVAGSGADAAPYFRIFNPVLQGEKFDPHGLYTKKYVPELVHMPDKYLFKPWLAPESVMRQAGVVLGKHYPKPIIDIKESRDLALNLYKKL